MSNAKVRHRRRRRRLRAIFRPRKIRGTWEEYPGMFGTFRINRTEKMIDVRFPDHPVSAAEFYRRFSEFVAEQIPPDPRVVALVGNLNGEVDL